MQSVIAKLDAMGDNQDAKDLKDVIIQVLTDQCDFCEGKGHVPRHCPSKKSLDEHFKLVKYSLQWGLIKSTVMQARMRDFSERLRKRTLDDFNVVEEPENVQRGVRNERRGRGRGHQRNN